ncbi:MAG: MurT ligase domain-containing protein [Oscillospiraceae bacterium]|nr:MurT ligase domain-containing protein [Oscillospiraceae bacterium]MDD4368806.1 MurT ligase domain-containing protein [Oscillospiraceae bacterium]
MALLRYQLACLAGRMIYHLLRLTGRQASTLPGRVTLLIDPEALAISARGRQILCVTGTNGKTTSTSVLARLLESGLPAGSRVLTNAFGANLTSGMMTVLLQSKAGDFVVLEADEAAFARAAASLKPQLILVTNIFRDQLDRYGELDTVYKLILKGCLDAGQDTCRLVLGADDPHVAALGSSSVHTTYFGAQASECAPRHQSGNMTDAAHCPVCGSLLTYQGRSISHMGLYRCPACDFSRPEPEYRFRRQTAADTSAEAAGSLELTYCRVAGAQGPQPLIFQEQLTQLLPLRLAGLYNAYNICGAVAAALTFIPQMTLPQVRAALEQVRPSFGRLERISYGDKSVCFILVKNPTGMEQGLRLVSEAKDAGGVIFFLNNHVNDGVDISWIWDAPLEQVRLPAMPVGAGGQRRGDMALRLHYALGDSVTIAQSEDKLALVRQFLAQCKPGQCLYLLPNYTAMLQLRQELAPLLGYERRWDPKQPRPAAADPSRLTTARPAVNTHAEEKQDGKVK